MIPSNRVCNDVVDCPDNSDEAPCRKFLVSTIYHSGMAKFLFCFVVFVVVVVVVVVVFFVCCFTLFFNYGFGLPI